MASSCGEKLAIVAHKSSCLLVDEFDEIFDRTAGLVRKTLLVVLREPFQRWVSADVKLSALGLVRIAIDLHNGYSRLSHKSLRYFLIVRGKALAVTAPRRVELNERVFGGVENDGVEVSFVNGDDGLGRFDNAYGVACFVVEIRDDAGGFARSVVFLDEAE